MLPPYSPHLPNIPTDPACTWICMTHALPNSVGYLVQKPLLWVFGTNSMRFKWIHVFSAMQCNLVCTSATEHAWVNLVIVQVSAELFIVPPNLRNDTTTIHSSRSKSEGEIEYKCIRHGMESSKINYLHFRIVFVGIIIFEGDITTWELGRAIHKEPPSAIIFGGSCWLPRPVCPSKWNGMLASVSAASAVWPRKIWN